MFGLEDFSRNNNFSKEAELIQLIDNYWVNIKKLAFTYVKDWSLAEDITQDVFIKCYKGLNDFRGDSSYKTWMFRIAVNSCKDVLRSNWFKALLLNDDIKAKSLKKGHSAEHVFLKKSDEELISKLVLLLPLKYREVIILFYYEELKLEEIHYLLGTNINTIKTRLKRGKALLKKHFERSER